jgi:hypothetical protein
MSSYNSTISGIRSTVIDGDNVKTLIISISSMVILTYFIIQIIRGIYNAVSGYLDQIRKIDGSEVAKIKDEYIYTDEIDNDKNYNNKIMESIGQIRKSNDSEFKKLTQYKKKHELDPTIYSQINTKTTSEKHDDYNYKNSPNVFDFINDVFRPT